MSGNYINTPSYIITHGHLLQTPPIRLIVIGISYLLLNIENEPLKIAFKRIFLMLVNISLIILLNIIERG